MPGASNAVADGITRVTQQGWVVNTRGEYVVFDDTVPRLYRFEGEDVNPVGSVESRHEDDNTMPTTREIERSTIFQVS